MQLFIRLSLTFLSLWTLLVSACWAETRYISDQLVVSLRERPQNNAESIQYLRTDTAVDVIEDLGDFVKVKTEGGETGFIKTHYLTTETPKITVIQKLQQERDRLAAKVSETKDRLSSVNTESNQAQQEMENLKKSLQANQAELQKTNADFRALQKDAQNVIEITKERDQLLTSNQELSVKITKLEKDVSTLTRTGVIKWFLAGGGVLFLGWIVGRASAGRRRRSPYQ